MAGSFYEADGPRLRAAIADLVRGPRRPVRPEGGWRALLLPHAGYVFSGPIAGAGVGAVAWPGTVVLLGPNHTGEGEAFAVAPEDAWRTPLGDVPIAAGLREDLLGASPIFALDAAAHRREHSLEVLVPFLQAVRPDVAILPIALGAPDLAGCREAGRAVAEVVGRRLARGERLAVVASSDLSHYHPRAEARRLDDRALDALVGGDPVELFERVLRRERISMCGVLPGTALLEALRILGSGRAEVVARGDSGDVNGDVSRVVGYASVLWEAA